MHFDERQCDAHRIFVAATPSSQGGYTAAVSVKRLGEDLTDRTVYTDLMLAGGFRFADPKAALQYAFDVGHRHLRQLQPAAH